jgi:hypothetical protein
VWSLFREEQRHEQSRILCSFIVAVVFHKSWRFVLNDSSIYEGTGGRFSIDESLRVAVALNNGRMKGRRFDLPDLRPSGVSIAATPAYAKRVCSDLFSYISAPKRRKTLRTNTPRVRRMETARMSATLEANETEQELIVTAKNSISHCNWTVGECAAKWTQRFSRDRTDADFGAMIGLSGDQIYQRRRVWESFVDVKPTYALLKWSHFYVALTWSDSAECLAWAEENEASVAEMKAWRRMQHGEDLTVEAEADMDGDVHELSFGEPILHQTPEEFGETDGVPATSDSIEDLEGNANRVDEFESEQADDYAPFRSDAGSAPPKDAGDGPVGAQGLTPELAVKRMISAIERCNRLITEQVVEEFSDLPEKIRIRFATAVENFNDKVTELG